MGIQFTRITKPIGLCAVVLMANISQPFASKDLTTSLLKSNQSFRSNLSSQPNLDKGEVALPVQASIIYIIKQSLPDFLLQLASRNNFELTLSKQVSGELEKISLPMDVELILPELSKTYGLEWHMQEKHLFVSNSLENTNRRFSLKDMDVTEFKSAIRKAGLNPGSNKMSYEEDKNAVTLIGSRQYLSKVEAVIKKHKATAKSN